MLDEMIVDEILCSIVVVLIVEIFVVGTVEMLYSILWSFLDVAIKELPYGLVTSWKFINHQSIINHKNY